MERLPSIEIKRDETDELSAEKNRKFFVESSPDEIELLANHLARPDGFAKTLILGSIVTSAELQEKIGNRFVKTHKAFYQTSPPHYGSGANDYISFNVGKPQRLYQESSWRRLGRDWGGGLGFVIPADVLLGRQDVAPSWGGFDLYRVIQQLKKNQSIDPRFKKYYGISKEDAWNLDSHPSKDGFLTLVHMARMAGKLTGNDQAEVNMEKEEDRLPRLNLDQVIILMPMGSRDAILRYLAKKIKEIKPYAEKIKATFGKDITGIDPNKVLEQYSNIYWYPQENIELAVEYLSTHPQVVSRLLSS